jgi:hypothetical protein
MEPRAEPPKVYGLNAKRRLNIPIPIPGSRVIARLRRAV